MSNHFPLHFYIPWCTGWFGLGLLLSGCSIPLMGAGEIGIGWTTTQRIYFYHTVDGDKEGKKSEAKLDLSPDEDPERCQEPATGK